MLIFRAIEGFFYVLRPTFALYSGKCACRKALMVSISQRSVPFPTKLHSVFHVFHYIEPAMRRKFMERLMLGLSWLGICDGELKSFNIYCLSKTNTTMIWQRFIFNSRTYKMVESTFGQKRLVTQLNKIIKLNMWWDKSLFDQLTWSWVVATLLDSNL